MATQVTTAAFGAKFRSKRGKWPLLNDAEVFTFLTVDVKAYLPPMNTVTIYFLKDLITGTKKSKPMMSHLSVIPMDHVQHVHVPSYENLALKLIYAFFEQHREVLKFLPEGKELLKTPKAWICNVGATVIGEPFRAWVGERIKERNETVTKERSMLIQMDERVAAAFHASTAVSRKYIFVFIFDELQFAIINLSLLSLIIISVQNGVAANMLKIGSKRRRPATEVKSERELTSKKEQELKQKMADLKSYENKLALQKNELRNGKEAIAIMNGLLKAGQIKQSKDGTWAAVVPESDKMEQ